MSNRFDNHRTFSIPVRVYKLISIAIFLGIAIIFIVAVDRLGRGQIEKQQESLESAIARDIVQCYAIEGQYPPTLEYMEEHYGLIYDKDTFFVDYQPIAANLYPDYTVLRR
ncbi:MAG: hypothetical protein K6C96_01470 [Butyrivibrio sp.]|nr:hypothetical protein [Butyrivibrio sp.]